MTRIRDDVAVAVDEILARVGPVIALGVPLGLARCWSARCRA